MTNPSGKDQPASPQVPPVIEGTVPQVTPPEVEATGKQIGAPPASTQVKPRKDQPEVPGYEFIKRLGKGGMGVVWLCRDLRADRLVALKQTISDELSESDRQRFRTEAQAMAKLQHPNIVHVYEVNEHEGRPYFTMDYCPGGSLHEYLDRKPQPAKICAEILEKLALGVQHAHEHGIIHRDLKPANVLLGGGGSVAGGSKDSNSSSDLRPVAFSPATSHQPPTTLKLTDFGLAKNTEASQHFTRTESVMGTPSYMSPEQGKETKSAGPSADVWSLGVILYECITGSLPFVGADLIEVLDNIRSKDPVPPGEKVKCPRDLETICLKCLRKDPRDRYASAQAVADDLQGFLNGRTIRARPVGRSEKILKLARRNPTSAFLLTGSILVLLIGTILAPWILGAAEQSLNKRTAEDLQGILRADVEALKLLLRSRVGEAEALSLDPVINDLSKQLINATQLLDEFNVLNVEKDLKKLRDYLKPRLKALDFPDFFIADTRLRIVASNDNRAIGRSLKEYSREYFDDILYGEAKTSIPFRDILIQLDESGPDRARLPTMLTGSPMRDQENKIYAAFAFRIRPDQEISKILSLARFGQTGDTYAFDRDGMMLSESRFNDDLRKIGLIPEGADFRSTLTVKLRDPGGNLLEGYLPKTQPDKQPLTLMVRECLAKSSSFNVEGYRDYRGVPVIGAWTWIEQFDFGVATETEKREALSSLRILEVFSWMVRGLLISLLIVISVLIWRFGT